VTERPAAWAVSALVDAVRGELEGGFGTVWVRGEVSGLSAPRSGHWYFTLKDESAQLRSVMFASANRRVRGPPRDGELVLVAGRLDVYPQRGDLQLVVDRLEPVGAGPLQRAFEDLKRRLEAEGLFDPARKRSIPAVPRRIGLVTSPQAAALHDMLRLVSLRDPTVSVTIAPCRVQGAGAAEEIAAALDLLSALGTCDVVLCGRGGGAPEDLWAFNEEAVARAIARCAIPVVSCVGHETDFTIADFVADLRAPTPSAAVERVLPVRADLDATLAELRARLSATVSRSLGRRRARSDELRTRLPPPRRRTDRLRQRVDELVERLDRASWRCVRLGRQRLLGARARLVNPRRHLTAAGVHLADLRNHMLLAQLARLRAARSGLESARRTLSAVGPLATLERGWAIAVDPRDERVLIDASGSSPGDPIRVRLRRGALLCTVDGVVDGQVDGRGRDAG
jgi:exodeoxyribonuclease VII large subunit